MDVTVEADAEAGDGEALEEAGVVDAVLGRALHRVMPHRNAQPGGRPELEQGARDGGGVDAGSIAEVMVDGMGRVEAKEEQSVLGQRVDGGLLVGVERVLLPLHLAIEFGEVLETELVGVVVPHLDDLRPVLDVRAIGEGAMVARPLVDRIGILGEGPVEIVVARDQHDLLGGEAEARHELLQEQARGLILLGRGEVRDVPRYGQRFEPITRLLSQVCRELRVPEGGLGLGGDVEIRQVKDVNGPGLGGSSFFSNNSNNSGGGQRSSFFGSGGSNSGGYGGSGSGGGGYSRVEEGSFVAPFKVSHVQTGSSDKSYDSMCILSMSDYSKVDVACGSPRTCPRSD